MRFLLTMLLLAVNTFGQFTWTPPDDRGMSDLNNFLRPFKEKLGLPSLAASVVSGTNLIAAGATGLRKMGEPVKVSVEDKYHIGSCTKSMTALLAIVLVRDGKIQLETKVGDVFPDWDLSDEVKTITLAMLLKNRSGIGDTPPEKLWRGAFFAAGTPTEQRFAFLEEFLKETPLAAPPGKKFIYSNFGFALAGAMLEKVTGVGWEKLMREKIFIPLGLKSAGFGPPSDSGKLDQPWGHQRHHGKYQPIPPSDNPAAIGPAGTVHCSILDLARYASFQMQVFQGKVPELAPYREFLYTPPKGANYAAGWIVESRKWAGGKIITHAGSNTMFYTVIWIAPMKNFAFVVSTNAGENEGAAGTIPGQCDQVIGGLIQKFIGL
jgi:CubicO group peptidase (beta-lactamase class C family)